MAKVGTAEFFRQVRQEASKVTWPSRKETMVSTAVVLVMVALAAAFFAAVDWAIFTGIQAILGF